ncbi:hypothetical protein J7384_17275 [Endozoicomonas sp. G2_1]|uniref:hypothetical protein n=1 Tax=Endozoicomonas sp. G2_1 TaxID=2821091 RepID=UPI001ADAC126|nr:hypothetical protein [Endozoicomonas sp. G2_1]MBO9492117.1 hypothetical protein [Endozoicomonas sp. G2_1]
MQALQQSGMSDYNLSILFLKSRQSLSASVEYVTPEIAKEYIKVNHENNRTVDNRVVESFAWQMLRGLWISASGETLKFDQKGKFVDGQHRALGVIRAAEIAANSNGEHYFKGVEFLVVTGVPEEAFITIDDGHKRTLSDAFKIRNMSVSGQKYINGAIKTLMTLRDSTLSGKHYEVEAGLKRRSTSESIAFYEQLKGIDELYWKFKDKFAFSRIEGVMPIAQAFAMYYLFHDQNEEACFSVFKDFEQHAAFTEKNSAAHLIAVKLKHDRNLRIRYRAWEYITYFLTAYSRQIEPNILPLPVKIKWNWDTSNPVISGAVKKLMRID